MTHSYLLNLLVGSLETAHTFLVDPDPNNGFSSSLHCDYPVLKGVHRTNIICVALKEGLLSVGQGFGDN
jgi:hypothetical protein